MKTRRLASFCASRKTITIVEYAVCANPSKPIGVATYRIVSGRCLQICKASFLRSEQIARLLENV